MITILGAVVNITGGHLHDHLMNMRIFTLIMGKIFMWASKTIRNVAMASI
jgi:hypothetical protein